MRQPRGARLVSTGSTSVTRGTNYRRENGGKKIYNEFRRRNINSLVAFAIFFSLTRARSLAPALSYSASFPPERVVPLPLHSPLLQRAGARTSTLDACFVRHFAFSSRRAEHEKGRTNVQGRKRLPVSHHRCRGGRASCCCTCVHTRVRSSRGKCCYGPLPWEQCRLRWVPFPVEEETRETERERESKREKERAKSELDDPRTYVHRIFSPLSFAISLVFEQNRVYSRARLTETRPFSFNEPCHGRREWFVKPIGYRNSLYVCARFRSRDSSRIPSNGVTRNRWVTDSRYASSLFQVGRPVCARRFQRVGGRFSFRRLAFANVFFFFPFCVTEHFLHRARYI